MNEFAQAEIDLDAMMREIRAEVARRKAAAGPVAVDPAEPAAVCPAPGEQRQQQRGAAAAAAAALRARPGRRRLHAAVRRTAVSQAGLMFWFIRKRFVGSYFFLSSTSRLYVAP